MMRLDDSRVIARSPPERRLIAKVLFSIGRPVDLLAFRVADTHVHALLTCARREAGRFAQFTTSGMRQRLRLPVGFNTHFRPVLDQHHLTHAFRYVLRQEERHGVCLDPTHDGSSLLDLLGLRLVAPWSIQRVRTWLPRIQSAELHSILGVDLGLGSASDGLEHLREAATAAASSFTERGALPNAARVAATHIARTAGLGPRQVGECLQLDARSVRRLEARPLDEAMARAVLLQMRLRAALWASRSDESTARVQAHQD